MSRVPSVHGFGHSGKADKRANDPGCTSKGTYGSGSTGRRRIQDADEDVHQQQHDQRHQ